MRSLNLDQLRALAEVVRLGSFSAAARRLNLSQPAVSLQLRELEARAGVRLVERLGKRAFATPAGQALIEHAERLGAEADAALATMRRHREGGLGRVRIGTSFVILNYLLPPILKRLRGAHPDLELGIFLGSSAAMTERLLRNEIDIGILTLPVADPHLAVTELKRDRMMAVLPPQAAAPRRLAPADFARWPLILDAPGSRMGRIVRDWLAADPAAPRPAMEIGDIHAIKTLVGAGLGASILPMDALGFETRMGEVALRPLAPPIGIAIGLVHRRDKPDEPALRIVKEAVMALRQRKTG
ncbi:MAG: LysR family transcriptional regulator [Rhodospirillaceae bacterium]|nr:LysR family transcriptional regulator [Rhodospirillaceae bacterium]